MISNKQEVDHELFGLKMTDVRPKTGSELDLYGRADCDDHRRPTLLTVDNDRNVNIDECCSVPPGGTL